DVVGGGGAVRDERGERLGALLPAALLDVEVVLGEADGEGGGRGLGEARALLLLGRLLGGGGREAFAQRVPDPVEQDDDDEGPEHRPADPAPPAPARARPGAPQTLRGALPGPVGRLGRTAALRGRPPSHL